MAEELAVEGLVVVEGEERGEEGEGGKDEEDEKEGHMIVMVSG